MSPVERMREGKARGEGEGQDAKTLSSIPASMAMVAILLSWSGRGILRCGYIVPGMSSSSVHRAPCWAGNLPVKRVARDGLHMAALHVAWVNVKPFCCNRVRPGKFASLHPGGKS